MEIRDKPSLLYVNNVFCRGNINVERDERCILIIEPRSHSLTVMDLPIRSDVGSLSG